MSDEEELLRTPENCNLVFYHFPTNNNFSHHEHQIQSREEPYNPTSTETTNFNTTAQIGVGTTPDNIIVPSAEESLSLLLYQYCHREQLEDLCDFSVTPMTSRPHNCSFLQQQRHQSNGSTAQAVVRMTTTGPLIARRVRSRSLGHAMERSAVSEFILPSPLEIPAATMTTTSDLKLSTINHSPLSFSSQRIKSLNHQQNPDDADSLKSNVYDDNVGGDSSSTSIRMCILYGMINATIVLPVLMSFTTIIYRDDAFGVYIPILVKLTMVSGIVHQLCFSTFSSMPFAVGQVQDAGLIFLSGMASSIVQYCQVHAHDDATMIATVTVGLSLATALLGVGLIGIGQLKLTQRVQQLPTCVVGGYLAYIGWFCGMSGIGLMAGSSHVTLRVLQEQFQFVWPGLLGGLAIYTVVTKVRHMAALPISIAIEIGLFYVILWSTGTSVMEATNAGWIRKIDDPQPSWTHTWDYLRFDKVDWCAYPPLVMTEMGMILVVALSSSLDVAAIELELKHQPLDYNHELKTVGLSNIVSGLTGGYTGSYIFSQSIFSLRAGIRNRVAGFALAGCQMLVVVAPFPILAYVPNYFFGSMLSMICIDLMYEWGWDVRTRLSRTEYLICLATFFFIQVLNVESGILAGVAIHRGCQRLGLPMNNSKQSVFDDQPSLQSASKHQEKACLLKGGDLPRYNSFSGSIRSSTNG